MPKVSVIIPIYNVSLYIERCARSLFEQTLDDVEFIFVDDCSPDDSINVLRSVLEKYPSRALQTHIISNEKNMGLPGARLVGLQYVSGDYVIHCDGDDWVDCDLYKKMYEEAVASDSDIVMCGSVHEYVDRSDVHEVGLEPCGCRDLLRNWYRKCIGMHCWNKLVRRSIYMDNDVFPWTGLNMWEDNGLMTRLFYHADKLSVVRDSYYHYNRMNVGAMTNGYGQAQVQQMIGVAERLTEFFESKPDAKEFEKTVMAFQFLAKLNLITDSFSRIREYKKLFPGAERITSELDPNAFSAKGRVRFNMVRHHLAWLFVLMFKVKKLLGR